MSRVYQPRLSPQPVEDHCPSQDCWAIRSNYPLTGTLRDGAAAIHPSCVATRSIAQPPKGDNVYVGQLNAGR